MTPAQIKEARLSLGLTLDEMAYQLGYWGSGARGQMHNVESGRRELRPPQIRLLQAYLSGFRPKDWPHKPE